MKANVMCRRGRERGRVDAIMVLLIAALALSVGAFLAGWLPYPFAILVFSCFIVARAMILRKGQRRDR